MTSWWSLPAPTPRVLTTASGSYARCVWQLPFGPRACIYAFAGCTHTTFPCAWKLVHSLRRLPRHRVTKHGLKPWAFQWLAVALEFICSSKWCLCASLGSWLVVPCNQGCTHNCSAVSVAAWLQVGEQDEEQGVPERPVVLFNQRMSRCAALPRGQGIE